MTHPMLDLDAWDAANGRASLVVCDGKSVTVNAYSGLLVIKDGPMGSARERSFARVPRTVKHVAVLNGHGYISLDAMRWMAETDVSWSVIDPSGRVPRTLAVSGGTTNAHYMRQQALCAPGMPHAYTGVRIMRHLITEKIEGQAHNAEYILGLADTAKEIRAMIPCVQGARSIESIMGHEGNAADTYWDAWRELPVVWRRPVPRQPHWLRFPSRRTLRRSWESNRGATDPVNAMLNFGYHCAEAECVLACHAHALAPNLGIGHVVRAGRESFALDLIEVMRPRVDEIVLGVLSEPLDKRHYLEGKEGMVSLCAPLTHRIRAEVHAASIEIVKSLFTVLNLLNGAKPGARKATANGALSDV